MSPMKETGFGDMIDDPLPARIIENRAVHHDLFRLDGMGRDTEGQCKERET